MTQRSSYDALQIANDFMESAQQLANQGKYADAYEMLAKAEAYAFGHSALLDMIQIRRKAFGEARRLYIQKLEEKVQNVFRSTRFDGSQARQLLQALLDEDSENELAKSLWAELPAKEAAEQERRQVQELRRELVKIWQKAQGLEEAGASTRAVEAYEQALREASKAAGNAPDSIPWQRLKQEAQQKRNRAKEKWEGTPTLILDQKGRKLVARYQTLKREGVAESEFFNEKGEWVGRLPIDECIRQAEEMASQFTAQKAQDYLGQARELLDESPRAAYEKIDEALSLAYLDDFDKRGLERELEERIKPAMARREEATAKLKQALSKPEVEEAWQLLIEAEQIDAFTPGLEEASERLYPLMLQKFERLLDEGQRFYDLEELETARARLQEAVEVAQRFSTYGFEELYPKAQAVFEQCIQAQQKAQELQQQLDYILRQSQSEPELAKQELEQLAGQTDSPQAKKKIDRVRVQVEFRRGAEHLFGSLEQRMLSAKNEAELIPIEEAAKQACLDYPSEKRFQKLVERATARRLYLKAVALKDDPEKGVQAQQLLQKVIDQNGDEALLAQKLIDEISANQKQEGEIAMAVKKAQEAFASGHARLAFLSVVPYRYTVSRQAAQIQQLISQAGTQWQNKIELQLAKLVNSGNLNLAWVEKLITQLDLSQSTRVEEWKIRALAPAYTKAAEDLQGLNKWEQAEEFWEKAFRLAPSDEKIVQGRRNAQKQRALIKANLASNPADKEQILTDLNKTYAHDLTIKRHLADFYYTQSRYLEAGLAISQALLLSDQLEHPELAKDAHAIRVLEAAVKQAQDIEKQKLFIKSQISTHTMVEDLWRARVACGQLTQKFPEHAKKLRNWWAETTVEIIQDMEQQATELSGKAGMVWERTELACKILSLEPKPQTEKRAARLLKMTYQQLPREVQSVIHNPKGLGYGQPSEALNNHMAKAKKLQKKVINITQAEKVFDQLKIASVQRNPDLEGYLYEIELTLEKLYSAQEIQRKVRSQIDVAIMTGEWAPVEDGLEELQFDDLSQHRGLKGLANEVQNAQEKRRSVQQAVVQIRTAMAQEEFEAIEQTVIFLQEQDPTDETLLQSNLEVTDPYSRQKIKGHVTLQSAISEKLAVLNKLEQWRERAQPAVDWQRACQKSQELADKAEFTTAIKLWQGIAGAADGHQAILQEQSWSLGHLRNYLSTPPVSHQDINSLQSQSILDEVNQRIKDLDDQIGQCHSKTSELYQIKRELSLILNGLTPLLERLKSVSFFRRRSYQVQQAKKDALRLLDAGRQLCPNYSPFQDLEEKNPILRS